MNDVIKNSLLKLKLFIEKEEYKGYDPYDALSSPLFSLPVINSSNGLRFLSQQFVKRFPLNLRPLLFIKKGLNPVTLGLCIQSYTDLAEAGTITRDEAEKKCGELMAMLEKLQPTGFSGASWGYDFPWQSRHFTLGALQPSIVATGIITNALFRYYGYSKNERALELCKSSCNFILNDLNRSTEATESICFSYTPFDHYKVYNASMKGVRTLAQVYSVTGESRLLETSRKAIQFVAENQQSDGSWFYAQGAKGKWIDSYHTGYILECMKAYSDCTGDHDFDAQLEKGFTYFQNNFFEKGCIPRFFNNETYPIDCTAGAQAILTLCTFGKVDQAKETARFLIEKMQSETGSFYFRAHKFNTEKTSFMRWSNAWMFAALSRLQHISR